MTEAVVQEWMSEWAGLDPSQVHSYAVVLDHNEELVQALQTILEERARFPNLLDPVCDQLFSSYRSKEPNLQRFTLQFLPTLIYVYLAAVAGGDKKGCKSIETLLLGMYNLEIVTETGEPLVLSFRMPSLAQGSIYHEPTREAITESALRRYEEVNSKPVTWGPHPQTEVLNAQNRVRVLSTLLFVYNRHIGTFRRSSLKNLCRMASKIVMQGFPRPGHHQRSSSFGGETSYLPKLPPRIPLTSQFLLELTSGLYYAMYNDFGNMAMQAVEDIYNRSCFECYSEVILIASAIKNSSHVTAAGQPVDGPMGISIAPSPATTTVTTVNKSMITNASFRTKKLPDDIPIISGEDGGNLVDGNQLVSITEEKEDEPSFTPRGASLRGKDAVTKNLQKLGIGKKTKPKTGTPVTEKSGGGDKRGKSIKSPVIHNGDVPDSTESPQGLKRKSTIENGDSLNFGGNDRPDIQTPDVLDSDSRNLDETLSRLDITPTGHRKLMDVDDKPLMQVSSV